MSAVQHRNFSTEKDKSADHEIHKTTDKDKLVEHHNGKSIYWSKEYHTIPNYITISRILACPLLTYAVATDMKVTALTGVILFAFSDWLDGFLAKRWNQQTTFGAALDPLADKFMIGSLSIGLMLKGLLPWELAMLFISRDVFLVVCGVIYRMIEKPKGTAFWDVRTTNFKFTPTIVSKVSSC
jgi:cardiolipin synthase